jgi:hypothetical protein
MASIGRLLFAGISFILLTNLVLLPALLERGISSEPNRSGETPDLR